MTDTQGGGKSTTLEALLATVQQHASIRRAVLPVECTEQHTQLAVEAFYEISASDVAAKVAASDELAALAMHIVDEARQLCLDMHADAGAPNQPMLYRCLYDELLELATACSGQPKTKAAAAAAAAVDDAIKALMRDIVFAEPTWRLLYT